MAEPRLTYAAFEKAAPAAKAALLAMGRAVDESGLDKSLVSTKDDPIQSSSTPRVAAGFGVIWQSPMGPINIDLAYPLVRQEYDKIQIFRLNFGQRF